jgi:hypothetical protein
MCIGCCPAPFLVSLWSSLHGSGILERLGEQFFFPLSAPGIGYTGMEGAIHVPGQRLSYKQHAGCA